MTNNLPNIVTKYTQYRTPPSSPPSSPKHAGIATIFSSYSNASFYALIIFITFLQTYYLGRDMAEIYSKRQTGIDLKQDLKIVVAQIRNESTRRYYLSRANDNSTRKHLSNYPPLEELVDTKKEVVIGNVSHLLDFAVIGFAKTGTTAMMMKYFNANPEVAIPAEEIHLLTKDKSPAKLAEMLYNLQPGLDYKRAFKASRDIGDPEVLRLIHDHWPNAKLIIGMRHPIEWFKSFYNFKIRMGYELPDAALLDGECMEDMTEEERILQFKKLGNLNDRGVCAELSRFHVRLSWMGKTNATVDPNEQKLLGSSNLQRHKFGKKQMEDMRMRNPVFLYDIAQIGDKDEQRQAQFQNDLQQFLGLNERFMPPKGKKPTSENSNFDICEDRYKALRRTLIKNGKDASKWIRKYFMYHPDVTVSSPEFFEQALKRWHIDPCDEKKKTLSADAES